MGPCSYTKALQSIRPGAVTTFPNGFPTALRLRDVSLLVYPPFAIQVTFLKSKRSRVTPVLRFLTALGCSKAGIQSPCRGPDPADGYPPAPMVPSLPPRAPPKQVPLCLLPLSWVLPSPPSQHCHRPRPDPYL